MQIVQNNGYLGLFAWELTGDTKEYELLKAMSDAQTSI